MLKFLSVLKNHANLCYYFRVPFLEILDTSFEFSNRVGQIKPILSLINVQYLQNIVFGLEKGLNGQKQSFSPGLHLYIN